MASVGDLAALADSFPFSDNGSMLQWHLNYTKVRELPVSRAWMSLSLVSASASCFWISGEVWLCDRMTSLMRGVLACPQLIDIDVRRRHSRAQIDSSHTPLRSLSDQTSNWSVVE